MESPFAPCYVLLDHTLCGRAYPLSGEGVKFDPLQVLGSYVWPTVGAYEPSRHLRDTEAMLVLIKVSLLFLPSLPLSRVQGLLEI